MKEQLIHILDQSVCLSRKQIKEYLSGTMLPEEMHAVEMHLNSCPLCNMAMEGFEEHNEEALAAIASLNSGFLKDHFDTIAPQIHLNSIASAATLPAPPSSNKRSSIPLLRTVSIAAAVILSFGTLWYFEFGRNPGKQTSKIAERETPANSVSDGTVSLNTPQQVTLPAPAIQSTPSVQTPGTSPKAEKSDYQSATSQSAAGQAPVASHANLMDSTSPQLPVDQFDKAAYAINKKKSTNLQSQLKYNAAPAGAKPVTAEDELEHAATKNTNDLASISPQAYQTTNATKSVNIGGGRTTGQKYEVDGVQLPPATATYRKEARAAETKEPGELEKGNNAFDAGKYSQALKNYTQAMQSGSSRERTEAAVKAARCYAALGNTAKARKMLEEVVANGAGPERRAARRALREMNR